jgi:protein-S-isoprenylcysteine O-methyltransferase Ste14
MGLGSLVGLVTLVPFAAIIVWRLLDEERYLFRHLPGYDSYQKRTRYRLIPHVW